MKEIKNVKNCKDETIAKAIIELDIQIKELQAQKKILDNELKSRYEKFDFDKVQGYTLTIRTFEEKRFDTKSFQAKHNELYELFRKPSTTQKLSVNTLKNQK